MPPNILVFMADDQRFDFLPYMPNVRNRIVAPGRSFDACRCNVALCQPTRVSFLTGQYSKRHRVLSNTEASLGPFDHDNTLAAWLRAAGYRTGIVGKYLNGAPPMIPKPKGWDTWRQLVDPTDLDALGYQVCDGSTLSNPSAFQVDYLRDEALAFMRGPEPWFLLVWFSSPHVPLSPEPADLFAWSHVRWEIVEEADISDKPSWIRERAPLPADAINEFRATARGQLRETTGMDRSIGSILSGTESLDGGAPVVVYCSDNGLFYGEHRIPANGIFKNDAYDPGLRVPLVVRGPGFPPGVSSEPVTMAADVTATLLAIAGVAPDLPGDGVDLRDIVSHPDSYSDRQLLHEHGTQTSFGTAPAGQGITTSTRKLYRYPSQTGTDRYQAYDLDTDPDELDNWANDPDRLDERDELESALDELLAAP
jgi:arylsulfatase A-like enzyme